MTVLYVDGAAMSLTVLSVTDCLIYAMTVLYVEGAAPDDNAPLRSYNFGD